MSWLNDGEEASGSDNRRWAENQNAGGLSLIPPMSMKPSLSQLRLISDEDLERELALRDHDEATRAAVLGEAIRRWSRAKARPNWVQWLTLAVAILAAVLAGIAAFPVLENFGESSWFDF